MRLPRLLLLVVLPACGTVETSRTAPMTLALVDSSESIGRLGREPMVVQHPAGALFAAGYGDTLPHLWRSDDDGHSWASVDVGTRADGAYGNSDVELAIGPDSTLYFLNMSFDRQRLEGTRIDLATSHDAEATWQWRQLSDTRLDDRPWIDVSPDNVSHAIWNDGDGIAHVRSTDGGRSWTELPRVAWGTTRHAVRRLILGTAVTAPTLRTPIARALPPLISLAVPLLCPCCCP